MREYLKAIGFSDLNSRKKIDELINEIKKNPSRKNWFQIDEEEAIFIYEKDFAFFTSQSNIYFVYPQQIQLHKIQYSYFENL